MRFFATGLKFFIEFIYPTPFRLMMTIYRDTKLIRFLWEKYVNFTFYIFSGLCPDCPAFYGNRAACHMMLGQFVQALEDARRSVQLDHSFVKGYVRIAKCCVFLGDVNSARQVNHIFMYIEKWSKISMFTGDCFGSEGRPDGNKVVRERGEKPGAS